MEPATWGRLTGPRKVATGVAATVDRTRSGPGKEPVAPGPDRRGNVVAMAKDVPTRADDRPGGGSPQQPVRVSLFSGDRHPLRPLFELAEDSVEQLDSYLDEGRVLVAEVGDEVVGHLQLVETGRSGELEIKNMAVREDRQQRGVGSRLVSGAVGLATAEGWRSMVVATAAAGIGQLLFYQRQGFRMLAIERDAFTPATGYPDEILLDGVVLRDRVWLDQPLVPAAAGSAHDNPASPAAGDDDLRLLLVCGGTRAGSSNWLALDALRQADEPGLVTDMYDRLRDVPAFVPGESWLPAPVGDVLDRIARADAVVFATPEYAGGLPGSLKNLLDWTVGGGQLYGKPVAWVDVANPGRGGGAQAQLRTVLGYVGARVVDDACVHVPLVRGDGAARLDPAYPRLLATVVTELRSAVRRARTT